ncbi:cytochrome P450 [Colletotrichum salicis]|uniref:Cytochrome P450 n=1 Tax=Colletotrichum salicis TaxID=1209931 RepID=A0A135UWQ5_9PEZI|nr:cytochrome P450 [Colletotrichum salicis]
MTAVIAYKIWTDHKFKLPPLINPPQPFDLSGAAVKRDFVQRSNETIQEGSKTFGGEPYCWIPEQSAERVDLEGGMGTYKRPSHLHTTSEESWALPTTSSFHRHTQQYVISDTGRVIMLAPKHVDEVRNDPKLSFLKNTEHDFHAYLPGFEPFGAGSAIQILILVAKRQRTKFLEWHEVSLGQTSLNVVSRLSSRVFLGPELCRNEAWLNITVMYVVDCFIAAERHRMFPKPLRRIAHWLLPECQRVRSHVAQTRSIIQPVIAARARDKRAAVEQGRPVPTYDDAIQWGEEESARPELVAALRSEMIEVLVKEGWAKTSIFNLKLLDSVMKETQRMKSIQSISMGRIADADVQLSDETVIPKGMKCAVANTSRHDPTIYEKPLEFDGYRFLRMRTTPGKENQAHFVTTGPDSLGFGHGQHACPGRFFAANEVKIAMCHLLLKYDLELVLGSDYSV